MSSQHTSNTSNHKLRHYIIMTTVVVAGLFVLLLFNNSSDSFGFTSAVVENVRNNSFIETFGNSKKTTEINNQEWEVAKVVPSTNDIEFLLKSKSIPKIKKETRVDSIDLIFNDLSTNIKVNGDSLELTGLNEVTLGINGFIGLMEFDETLFSLDGIAKRLEVNGISLSSNNEIKISFKELNYQRSDIIGAEFKNIEFVSGEGNVIVGSRLDYDLEKGQLVTIYNYFGDLSVSKKQDSYDLNSTLEDTNSRLEGFAKGLDIVNGELNLNLR